MDGVSDSKGVVLALLASAMWGLSAVLGKLALAEAEPFFILGFRFMIASLLMIPLLLYMKKTLWLPRTDLAIAVFIGVVGSLAALGVFYYGLDLTNAINASFLERAYPLFAVILAIGLLKERLSVKDMVGILFVILGSYVIIFQKGFEIELLGNFLLFIAAFLWGMTTVIAKYILKRVDAYVLTFYRLVTAGIGGMIIAIFLGQVNMGISMDVWYAIILSGIMPAFLGFLFFYRSLDVTKASKAASITATVPLFAVVYAFFFLGEIINIFQIGGGALIVLGAFFLAKGEKKYQPEHQAAQAKLSKKK
jgi:drug/metabolite transporter (DMT)-like permease